MGEGMHIQPPSVRPSVCPPHPWLTAPRCALPRCWGAGKGVQLGAGGGVSPLIGLGRGSIPPLSQALDGWCGKGGGQEETRKDPPSSLRQALMRATGLEWVMTQWGGGTASSAGVAARPLSTSPAAQDSPSTTISITGKVGEGGAGEPPISMAVCMDPHHQLPGEAGQPLLEHHPPDRHPPTASPVGQLFAISITIRGLHRRPPHNNNLPGWEDPPRHHHPWRWKTDTHPTPRSLPGWSASPQHPGGGSASQHPPPLHHQHHRESSKTLPPPSLPREIRPPHHPRGGLLDQPPPLQSGGGAAHPPLRVGVYLCWGGGSVFPPSFCPRSSRKGVGVLWWFPKPVGWGLQGSWGLFSGVPKALGRIDGDRAQGRGRAFIWVLMEAGELLVGVSAAGSTVGWGGHDTQVHGVLGGQ